MAGIVVGVDGSGHSRKALERAAAEAVAHGAPLTVLVVHQAVRDVYGSPSHYPEDRSQTEKAKEAAQAETDQVLAGLGPGRNRSRSPRCTACRPKCSSRRAKTPTCSSLAGAAWAVSPG